MLINTGRKIEKTTKSVKVENQAVSTFAVADGEAANSSNYSEVKRNERRYRRERRNGRSAGFGAGGWRLSSW